MDDRDQYEELKANGMYKLSLSNLTNLTVYEWKRNDEVFVNTESESNYLPKVNLTISDVHLKDTIRPFNASTADFVQDDRSLDDIADGLYSVLKQSVLRRVKNIPNYCKSCSHLFKDAVKFNADQQITCPHAKVGILFSGGVDSAVIAALVDECLPRDESIDLLNIAFEMQKADPKSKFLVPDRISGAECLKELNPNRNWNFVEVNITLEELRQERESHIRHLLYPHQTVLDDSIGCALWFASRGRGQCNSNAEVLLLGMGADEQLGGYARHRTRYEKSGMESLCEEMKMEMDRISQRNLGRDDRIISDHGKESRLPFLDEDLISFLNQLEVRQKCNMTLARGIGEKYLLRYLARTRLGLNYASRLQKRAIQFGSRVAKIENVKEKASDICDRLAANLNISNYGEE